MQCIHGGIFPCAQCKANRSWNQAATGNTLTEEEFRDRYADKPNFWTEEEAVAADAVHQKRCIHGKPLNVFCGHCET